MTAQPENDGRRVLAWLGEFGDAPSASVAAASMHIDGAMPRPPLRGRGGRTLHLVYPSREWSPSVSEDADVGVVFDGILDNSEEIRVGWADRLGPDCNGADLVRTAFKMWGDTTFRRLRGRFALIVFEKAIGRISCARDPLGLHPLYYAGDVGKFYLSPSIDTLLRHPCVSGQLNRSVLAEHLAGRWQGGDETYFAQVKRIPPGHVARFDAAGPRITRFWDPVPLDRPIAWIPDDEVQDRFDMLLKQAVGRCVSIGPAGISLSGGVDSTSVAMVAADTCREAGMTPPWGLSVVFPGPHVDEAVDQQRIAAAMGLPLAQLPLDQITGGQGLLPAALQLSRHAPAPLWTILRPALQGIALEGRRRGCRMILTGDGADEWVGVSPYLAADLLRSFDFGAMRVLRRSLSQEYPWATGSWARKMLWDFGARALLVDAWHASSAAARARGLARKLAPGLVANIEERRTAATRPAFVAPDAALRAELQARESAWKSRARGSAAYGGFHLQTRRALLEQPRKWMCLEESFGFARHAGLHLAQPFWDADLIDFLLRTRPQARLQDGRPKSLLRAPVVRRYPGLGFQDRRKSYTGKVILSAIRARATEERSALGRITALTELGVVDTVKVEAFLDRAVGAAADHECLQIWELFNLETWARSRL